MALVFRNFAETLITSTNDETFAEASEEYRCRSGKSMAGVMGRSPNKDCNQMSRGTLAGNAVVSEFIRGMAVPGGVVPTLPTRCW